MADSSQSPDPSTSPVGGSADALNALVTGASRGLGLEIARHLARAGANLAVTARDARALAEAGLAIRREVRPGKTLHSFVSDLADPDAVDRLVTDAVGALGQIDVLVNNAGIQGPIGTLDTVSFDEWRTLFQVNLFAPTRLCQLLIPAMRERRYGKLIQISGGGATSPRPNFSAYGVSKCALVRLTETLAVELAGTGIDVNAVAPGPMNTRMLQEVLDAGSTAAGKEYGQAVARSEKGGVPLEKAAQLVTFLAGHGSDGITGRLISAVWDDWQALAVDRSVLNDLELYTLRRTTLPKVR